MTDERDKVVTLDEVRARRAAKRFGDAGINTRIEATNVTIELGDKPSDMIQKVIDMYTRVQVACDASEGDYVLTPIEHVLGNLYNVKELFQAAEHHVLQGMVHTVSEGRELKVQVENNPLKPYSSPPRPVPKLHVVQDCSKCPMEHEGYCTHPRTQLGRNERLSDCDEYYDGEPHPRCPLRTHPVYLRVNT